MAFFVEYLFIQFLSTKISNRNLHYLENSAVFQQLYVRNAVTFSFSFFCL